VARSRRPPPQNNPVTNFRPKFSEPFQSSRSYSPVSPHFSRRHTSVTRMVCENLGTERMCPKARAPLAKHRARTPPRGRIRQSLGFRPFGEFKDSGDFKEGEQYKLFLRVFAPPRRNRIRPCPTIPVFALESSVNSHACDVSHQYP
jgi:hypothetical protein